MESRRIRLRGHGAATNPANRFEGIAYEADGDDPEPDSPAPATQFFPDRSRSIIATNDSPDVGFRDFLIRAPSARTVRRSPPMVGAGARGGGVRGSGAHGRRPKCPALYTILCTAIEKVSGFSASINPYRGCEHGCAYCYARPTHEYLGFSAGIDFETKILVKEDAPELLRKELSSPRWRPQPLGMSGVTDPYQPVERRLQLTRRCLEVLAEFRNPVAIITKNRLVTRDLDLLQGLAGHQAALVFVSVTTLDNDLQRRLEPRTTRPVGRLAAIEALARAGVPAGVMVAPVIPGLTDHEIPAILSAAAGAGACAAGYTLLRLPLGVGALFEQWLERHFPERKEKVLGRIRECRDGRLNDSRFGSRMRGDGKLAQFIADFFHQARQRVGLDGPAPQLSTAAFRRPGGTQRLLFEE